MAFLDQFSTIEEKFAHIGGWVSFPILLDIFGSPEAVYEAVENNLVPEPWRNEAYSCVRHDVLFLRRAERLWDRIEKVLERWEEK